MLRCTSQGCQKDLWRQGEGRPTPINSNATCASCQVVIFCIDHLRDVWADAQGMCPYCGDTRWIVRLMPNTRFSPQVQAAVLEAGGQVRMIEPEPEGGESYMGSDGRRGEPRRSQPLGARGARAYGAATRTQARPQLSEPTSNDSLPTSSALAALRDPYAERSSVELDPYREEHIERSPREAQRGRFDDDYRDRDRSESGRRGYQHAQTEDYQSGGPSVDEDPYDLYADSYPIDPRPQVYRDEPYDRPPHERDAPLPRERRARAPQRLRREESPPPTSPRRGGSGRRPTQVGHPQVLIQRGLQTVSLVLFRTITMPPIREHGRPAKV